MDSGFKPLWIPDSSPLDSGSQQQKFAGFRIPDSLTWGKLFKRIFFVAAVVVSHINNRISNIKSDKRDHIIKIKRYRITQIFFKQTNFIRGEIIFKFLREMNHIATDTKNLVPAIPIFVFSLLSHFSLTSRVNSNIEELPVAARAHKIGKTGHEVLKPTILLDSVRAHF